MHKYNFNHSCCTNDSTNVVYRHPFNYAYLLQLSAHRVKQEAIRHDEYEKLQGTRNWQKGK